MVKWEPLQNGFYADLTSSDDSLILEVALGYRDSAKTGGPYYQACAFGIWSTESFSTPDEAKKCAEDMARELLSEALASLNGPSP